MSVDIRYFNKYFDVGAGAPPVRLPARPAPLQPSCAAYLRSRLQAGHFLRRQMPKFPGRNIELQRSIAHPLYFLHMMPDGLEHLPDLAVLAFDQRNFVPGIVGLANGLDLGGRCLCRRPPLP